MAFLPLFLLTILSIRTQAIPRTNDLGSAELESRRENRQKILLNGKFFDAKPSRTSSSSTASTNTVDGQTSGNSNNTTGGNNNGTKYKVIRVVPETDVHLKLLERLEINGADLELNFWTSPVRIKSGVDIMLPAEKVPLLRRYIHKHRIHTEVIIEDVERLIIQRERKIASSGGSGASGAGGRFKDDPGGGIPPPISNDPTGIDFYHYNSYAQMVAWMRSLAKRYPKFVQFISVGKSHEGRGIDGLEIGSRGFRKRAFWIDGGIHAREWAAPHTAMYFIHQLTSRYGHDEDVTRLVNEITWIVVPLLNPDGYEYTRSSTNPNIRLWRKNRSPTHCVRDQWGRQRCCKGVDLNRNFDFHFKESGSSDDPCSEIYQGKNAFSEPEAKAVRDAILSNRYRGRIDGFITLHTYSQIWIHPYGHKRDSYPGDVQDLYAVGKKATAALSRLYGTKYVIGSGADTLYPASGGSEDWAKESANIKFVYLLELRPDEKNWDGFILDETQLIPTASETWAGVKVVADAIIQRARARRVASGIGIANSGLISPNSNNLTTGMHRISGLPQFRPPTSITNSIEKPVVFPPLALPPPMKQKPMESIGIGNSNIDEFVAKQEQEGRRRQEKECFDRRRACRRWVLESPHICQAVPVFMGDQCARSCGFC